METMTVRTPWHLWLVGVLSLLWNAIGAYFYIMTVTRNPAYLAQLPPEQVQLMTSAPVWSSAAYAVAIWGAVAGALLLLVRRKWAVWAFALSLAGFLINALQVFVLANGFAIIDQGQTIFSAVLLLIMLFQLWYARMMAKRGVLR